MSHKDEIQPVQTMLNSITNEIGDEKLSFYDEELSVVEVITLLSTIWKASQELGNFCSHQIDGRTVCYWLLRALLIIKLESEEIAFLFYEHDESAPDVAVPEKGLLTLKHTGDLGKFFNQLHPVYLTDTQEAETKILNVTHDIFITALISVIRLYDSGYFRSLTEETVNGMVIMAEAASGIDLSRFPAKHTSEMVVALANKCIQLHEGSYNLGLAKGALKIIFERMGRELSLKGSAMFVRAVNNDNPLYSPSHNTLLAKLVQPWSYWARRRRREESLNAQELYLLSFILSQTVPKTALVNVGQSRVEVMESIKLYLEDEEQGLLRWMLSNTRRIKQAAAKCDLDFSEVQFLMFNHIIYGWCSGYGAGVNFDLNCTGERQLLWQRFDPNTIKMIFDVSVSYIQISTWKKEFGVSRLQFARSTLECIIGVFRHVDLFKIQPAKCAFQSRIVVWIEKIVLAIAPQARDPSSVLTLRELASVVSALSSTKRAIHANGYLPFKTAHDLNKKIEGILERQLIAAIEVAEIQRQAVENCFRILDEAVQANMRLTLAGIPYLGISLQTEELYIANVLVEELIMRTVKNLFVSADFLLQLVNAGRPDLAAIWLFVLKKTFDSYAAFIGKEAIWTDLSMTEQQVFKRNTLIATTIIDQFLRRQENGSASFYSKAQELGISPGEQINTEPTSDLMTLRWLSPVLENAIRTEITKYQPMYGHQSSSNRSSDSVSNHSETTRHSREKGTFTNSFESQVFGYVRDYLEKLRHLGTVKSYALQPNIRIFKCEIDLVVEVMLADDSSMILLIECEGESWHSTFGVRNPLDIAKAKVKTSPELWKLVGVATVPGIVTVPHREFKSRRGTEQRRYVESLLAEWFV